MLIVGYSRTFGGAPPATISFTGLTDQDESSSNLTVYTHSSQAISTAAANRQVVVVAVGRGGGGSISSITIGGVSASISQQLTTSGTTVGIAIATVPTGTTADVVVTYSTGQARASVAVYVMYGASTTAADTATDAASAFTQALDIPAGGVAIGGFASGSNATATWTNLSENVDTVFAEDPQHYTMASDYFASEQSGLSITVTPTSSTQPAMVLVSYGPA